MRRHRGGARIAKKNPDRMSSTTGDPLTLCSIRSKVLTTWDSARIVAGTEESLRVARSKRLHGAFCVDELKSLGA